MLSSKGQMVSLQLAFLVSAVNDFTKSSFSNILKTKQKRSSLVFWIQWPVALAWEQAGPCSVAGMEQELGPG